jgi:thiol-disulfide isomerase/thioredoxin
MFFALPTTKTIDCALFYIKKSLISIMTTQIKWFSLALIASLFQFSLQAQINFESTAWKVAAEKAAKNNQLLFVDAYATWCGPCKWMSANVFTDKSVGEYYNANFVNLKLDMETADGKSFGMKYPVAAYPTLMFIDPKGNLVYKIEGSRPAADFLAEGKTAKSKYKPTNNGGGNNNNSGTELKVKFEKTAWKTAHTKAINEGKLLFVDAYAVWCGPCKWMDKNVFVDQSVGDYFNANFVNLKLDMETADGGTFNSKFPVRAYPTFLFIDSKGTIIHKVEGSLGGAELIEEGKKAKAKMGNKPNPNPNKGGTKGGGEDPNNGGGGGEQPQVEEEFNYDKEAKKVAQAIMDCFGTSIDNVFSSKSLTILEKMLTFDTEDEMYDYLDTVSEADQDRIDEEMEKAMEITEGKVACLDEVINDMEESASKSGEFDSLKMEELILEKIKSKKRALYVWLKYYGQAS